MTIYAGKIESNAGLFSNVTRIFDPLGETEGLVISDDGSYGVISDCILTDIIASAPNTTPSGWVITSCKASMSLTINESSVIGCYGPYLSLIGNDNDISDFKSIDCSFFSSYGIRIQGDHNIVNGGSVGRSTLGPSGASGVSCLRLVGDRNQVIDTELDGNIAGNYNVIVDETSTNTKLMNLGVSASAGVSRYSVAEETCVPSETKEWGKGGLVDESTSVILRAWRDALIIDAYFNLGTSGSTDTDVDLLLNGSIIGSVTISAFDTEGFVQLSTEINPGDLLTVEVTVAGTDAADISAQVRMV